MHIPAKLVVCPIEDCPVLMIAQQTLVHSGFLMVLVQHLQIIVIECHELIGPKVSCQINGENTKGTNCDVLLQSLLLFGFGDGRHASLDTIGDKHLPCSAAMLPCDSQDGLVSEERRRSICRWLAYRKRKVNNLKTAGQCALSQQ